jgi:hypothetical protein
MGPDDEDDHIDDVGEGEDANEEVNDEGEAQGDGGEEADLSAQQHGEGEGDGQGARAQQKEVKSRGENRFQTIANRAKAAEERATRLEQEFAQFRQQNGSQDEAVRRQREAERYALLSPEEQMREDIRRADERNTQQLRQIQFQLQEQQDINNFNTIVNGSNGRFNKYKEAVENQVKLLRAQGSTIPRELVLDYMIGKEVREKGLGAASRQAASGKAKIASQKTSPSNNRGDVNNRSRQPANEQAARRQRLEGLDI